MLCCQFQQAVTTERRTWTETSTFTANSREWKDSKVAVYTTVWRTRIGDQKTKSWGKFNHQKTLKFYCIKCFLKLILFPIGNIYNFFNLKDTVHYKNKYFFFK